MIELDDMLDEVPAREGMSDNDLCALIDNESRTAIGVNDQFATDRMRAHEFYLGEAKGELQAPDVEGRSKIVSKTLMDTVEWTMPALMRMFSQDDVIRFEPDGPEDDQGAEDATKYIAHLFYRKNNGFTTLHDAIKSCLIARMGVIKVWCDKSNEDKQETYRGCSQAEVDALSEDPEIEVVSVEPGEPVPQAGMMQGMPPEMAQSFIVTAKRRMEKMQFKAEGVPPEEIRIAKDTRTIDDCRYISHEVERTVSDLVSEGWPEDEVKKLPKDTFDGDMEDDHRHAYDDSADTDTDGDASQRKVTVTEAYIRVDFDKDGIAEYRRVLKAGTYVHENEIVDDHPFALFCPILMPYKVIGLSYHDLMEDLQRIHTALTRQMLDNAYLANNPQTDVVVGQVNLDDVLNPRIGGIRRVTSMDAIRSNPVTFIGPQALVLLQHFSQVGDTRSGVTEMNSALNSESLAKGNVGSEGVQSLISAGQQRLELVARVLAETGVKRTWKLLLKLATQYQDRVAQMKVNGHWMQIDPRSWKNSYDMTVSVGVGNAGRAQKLTGLQMVAMAQEKAFAAGVVKPENVYNLVSDLAKMATESQPDRYFSRPQPPQPPGPSEAEKLEQLKQQGAQQLAQVKGQVDTQLAQTKAQADVHVAEMQQTFQHQQQQMEKQLEAERNHAQMQNEMALEQYKTEQTMQLEMAKAQMAQETAIRIAQINAEASAYAASLKPEPNGKAE